MPHSPWHTCSTGSKRTPPPAPAAAAAAAAAPPPCRGGAVLLLVWCAARDPQRGHVLPAFPSHSHHNLSPASLISIQRRQRPTPPTHPPTPRTGRTSRSSRTTRRRRKRSPMSSPPSPAGAAPSTRPAFFLLLLLRLLGPLLAWGLVLMGWWDTKHTLTHSPECEMTYSRPVFIPVPLKTTKGRGGHRGPYRLFSLRDTGGGGGGGGGGGDAQPVLFIHGHMGSYKQARSLHQHSLEAEEKGTSYPPHPFNQATHLSHA